MQCIADCCRVLAVLPKYVRKPADVVMGAVHGQVVVECEVHGVPTPSVTWLKNGEVIVPSDYFQLVAGNSLRILGLVLEDDGIYQCLVDSEIGSTQAAAQLTVTMTTGITLALMLTLLADLVFDLTENVVILHCMAACLQIFLWFFFDVFYFSLMSHTIFRI